MGRQHDKVHHVADVKTYNFTFPPKTVWEKLGINKFDNMDSIFAALSFE